MEGPTDVRGELAQELKVDETEDFWMQLWVILTRADDGAVSGQDAPQLEETSSESAPETSKDVEEPGSPVRRRDDAPQTPTIQTQTVISLI